MCAQHMPNLGFACCFPPPAQQGHLLVPREVPISPSPEPQTPRSLNGSLNTPPFSLQAHSWQSFSETHPPLTWPCSPPDINECLQLPGPCAYQCHNLQGSYRCLCPPGQTLLRDGKTCSPLERSEPNVTTVSHRDPLVDWLRARAPKPGGSYHAWVSLRPGPRALSMGRAWCPPGFIRQNGVCTGKTEPRGTHPAMLSQAPRLGVWAPRPCSETQGSQASRMGDAGRRCPLTTWFLGTPAVPMGRGLPKWVERFPNLLTSGLLYRTLWLSW